MIVDEEGDASGASPSLDARVSLNIFLGAWGIPKLEPLTLLDLLSSSSFAHMKTPFIRDAREISVSFLVGYPKWKVRCSTAAVSLSEDAKV